MLNQYFQVKDSIVVCCIESDTKKPSNEFYNYADYDNVIPFHNLIGCSFDGGQFYQPEPVAQTDEEIEREWRNGEINIVVPLVNEAFHPYKQELEYYLQELRDYPAHPDFPNGERPERPVTPSGAPVII